MRVTIIAMATAALCLTACEDEPPRPAPEEPIEGAIPPPAPTEELAEDTTLPADQTAESGAQD